MNRPRLRTVSAANGLSRLISTCDCSHSARSFRSPARTTGGQMPDKFVGSLTGVRTADQTKTLVTLNCDNGGGDLYLANNAGTWTIAARAVESTHCGLWMGGSGQFGLLTLRNS